MTRNDKDIESKVDSGLKEGDGKKCSECGEGKEGMLVCILQLFSGPAQIIQCTRA